MKGSFSTSLLLGCLSGSTATGDAPFRPLIQSILSVRDELKGNNDHRSLASSNERPNFLNQNHRQFRGMLEEEPDSNQYACDAAFAMCAGNEMCPDCFDSLEAGDVNWASVDPSTPCTDVLGFLGKAGHCTKLALDPTATKLFCTTFASCVTWDPGNADDDYYYGDENDENGDEEIVNCDDLKECNWDGIRDAFIGDGVCNDAVGCYNTAICGYDGGDCCKETCETKKYVECGSDGYVCRNTESTNCDSLYTNKCKNADDKKKNDKPKVECGDAEFPYRLNQYDSWGDGWDTTMLKITPKDYPKTVVYEGKLEDGSQATDIICLSNEPTCYQVTIGGGVWGAEVSWDVKAMKNGAPSIAEGGSPMDCTFSVGGEVCPRTCDGKPDTDISKDPNYKTFKDLSVCINEKCIIQVGACEADRTCLPCMTENSPDYCFANKNYMTLVDCALCGCLEDKPAFCEKKLLPSNKDATKAGSGARLCKSEETLRGVNAVMLFSKCSRFEEMAMMVTNFDENNFGALDLFESCAHTYKNVPLHGGKTALECMRILTNAMQHPNDGKPNNPDTPTGAIAALAFDLYRHGEELCDCAQKSFEVCPNCKSFTNFRTLLHETLDACQALDEIDCDAWNDFSTPCRNNMMQMFSKIDFTNSNQCNYIHESCGGVGPFPAFRKLDCGKEIEKEAWDFYLDYDKSCLGDDDSGGHSVPTPKPPPPAPTPTPPQPDVAPSSPSTDKKTSGDGKKPYVPPDDSDHHSSSKPKSKGKNKHHFLKFLFVVAVGGGAYWYHRRRSDSFEYVRYRRTRGADDMYSSLSMEASASSFEPPTLPPTPSAMESA